MKFLATLMMTTLFALNAFAGFGGYNGTTNIGLFQYIKCSTGLTCTKQGSNLVLTNTPGSTTGSQFTNFHAYQPYTLTSGSIGTGVNPNSGTLYLTQVYMDHNATLSGVAITNGATVGTNYYVVALYNAAGSLVANSNIASGTISTGANSYQKINFLASAAVTAGTYWVGVAANGATDQFITTPAIGQGWGLAGSSTGNTGWNGSGSYAVPTTVSGGVPTSFTAGLGPIVFTY